MSAADTSEEKASTAGPEAPQAGRFGTFGGVFTPSILTILGVVMYLLLGKVTGQAGLGLMLIIVIVAHMLSIATGLSISSIATNRTVGAGGAYFMISRSLGAATGAAVGIPLFFAQALSVTFYIVGFTDSLVRLIPHDYQAFFPPMLISTLVNIGLTFLSFKSADLAIKAQYVVMVAIIASLASFFGGHTADFPREIVWFNADGPGFGLLFAIFFPAVTGIMAGVGMSGDLKDPRKAIPRGTLAAIFVGMIVYIAFPIWLALNVSNSDLEHQPNAVWLVAAVPSLIYLGVWGATLSSALGSIMTAPRTLQALAMDGLMPRFLGKGTGPANEPRVGILLTFFLAQGGIFLGSLDAIAPVLTMFFLTTYGVVNLASGLQRWAASPSWRPSFRVPAFISLAGAFGCFYVMSVIDLGAMVAALFFCFVIWLITTRRTLHTTYGDARHGIWAALVRTALQRMRRVEWHPENWRPNLVILGGNPQKRAHLLHLGNAIVQDRGLVTYFHLLRGKVSEQAPLRQELFESYDAKIAEKFANVFYRVDVVDDVFTGTVQVAQSYGVGSFEANTVMLGWSKKPERAEAYAQMCRDLIDLDRSLLLVSHNEEKGFGDGKLIHIWWGGLEGNGGLMLLIAFLLTAHHRWRKARIEVLTVVESDADKEDTERRLAKLLAAARLEAKARVVLRQRRTIAEVMHVESANADLAIIGLRVPEEDQPAGPFFERMNIMLAELPTTILVQSARNFASEPVLFDAAEAPSTHPPPMQESEDAADEASAEQTTPESE
ncbi:MAG: amino acid permease [Deltaproteobacteria bacterium]|nr:amino acid permease [Deltaproteobacteria bacterium]